MDEGRDERRDCGKGRGRPVKRLPWDGTLPSVATRNLLTMRWNLTVLPTTWQAGIVYDSQLTLPDARDNCLHSKLE